MITILSLVTSIKDYVEIVHKIVETNSTNGITTYYDLGATVTFSALLFKETLFNFLSLKWLHSVDLWSIPNLIPDIASSIISEISVAMPSNPLTGGSLAGGGDLTFLEKPLSYGNQNLFFYCLEKFIIGVLNSVFLCFATSTSSLITLRRFVMQGLEAGSIAGLGSIVGNLVWLGSILFGFRFIVIPWLSLDILRYILGFVLLVKYMWDSYSERRSVLTDLSKPKIFVLNFLLAFTEQTNIFPFLNNLSIGSDSTILETFPALSHNQFEFFLIHGCYLLGILLGSLSLLQLTCWFWENPAYNLYMWTISSFKVSTSFYSKFLNFIFLYLTMICTINSIGYFGLDYTLTNPLGFVHEDRLIEQKVLLETSFLNSKASDRNTRRNRGRHGRRERWKRRVRSYRTFDASVYDQGVYDLFPIEDLNYGFDRFWLRRKIRNHRVRFRFFPGPWMRSLKKQFARPRLESFMGPRVEFFRILFEQAYNPEFHEFKSKGSDQNKASNAVTSYNDKGFSVEKQKNLGLTKNLLLQNLRMSPAHFSMNLYGLSQNRISYNKKDYYYNIGTNSFLRKFIRKVDNRLKFKQVQNWTEPNSLYLNQKLHSALPYREPNQSVSARKEIKNSEYWSGGALDFGDQNVFHNFYKNLFQKDFLSNHTEKKFSKSDQFIAQYKNLLRLPATASPEKGFIHNPQSSRPTVAFGSADKATDTAQLMPLTLLHPLKFYIQKDEAFRKKCKFYGVKQFRSYNVENNAPYFRVMMKRFFYYYKPTLRWERTMRVATMRKARRKTSRTPRKWNVHLEISTLANLPPVGAALPVAKETLNKQTGSVPNPMFSTRSTQGRVATENIISTIQKPTDFYSLVSKKASRYRYQIYKDVLQHWYYSKMNRLLLKFDVDSFIKRQPKNHFLTKNEETGLHVKRFLLFEYLNSLRWYNYMQHYNTMKTTIGKTKSLANRSYNQQFFGTFKKIRHLFAINPGDQTVLKFDQPLYNEFQNTSAKSIVSESIMHEELQQAQNYAGLENSFKTIDTTQNLFNQKSIVSQNNLNQSIDLEKNSTDLTKFLFNKNKNQTNIGSFQQTNDLNAWAFSAKQGRVLLPSPASDMAIACTGTKYQSNPSPPYGGVIGGLAEAKDSAQLTFCTETKSNNLNQNLWFTLLRKCQNKIYDQKALKNFVLSKVEKNEKLTYNKQKQFKIRLEKLKNWSIDSKKNLDSLNPSIQTQSDQGFFNPSDFPSTIEKAMKEALYRTAHSSVSNDPLANKQTLVVHKNKKRIFKKRLNQNHFNNFNQTILNTKENLKKKILVAMPCMGFAQTKGKCLIKGHRFSFSEQLKSFLSNRKSIVKQANKKSLEVWRQTEQVLSKRKKIRKTFKRLKNVQNFSFSSGQTNQGAEEQGSIRSKLTFFNQKSLNQPVNSSTRKKVDTYDDFNSFNRKNRNNWQLYQKNLSKKDNSWKKRRSRIRRYRFFKGRGPIKKRTLGEKLKSKFRFFKKYGSSTQKGLGKQKEDLFNNQTELMKTYHTIFQSITKNSDSAGDAKLVPEKNLNLFETRPLKQSRTLVQKHRYWKKHKKPVFAQNKRKLRKRRRYLKAKIRVLTKKLKKIEFQSFIKKWWIRFQNQTSLNQAYAQSSDYSNANMAIQYKNEQTVTPTKVSDTFNKGSVVLIPEFSPEAPISTNKDQLGLQNQLGTSNVVSEFMRNILPPDCKECSASADQAKGMPPIQKSSVFENIDLNNLNHTPFYAGWDESSRKFVVTNRLLSRKNAGYSYDRLPSGRPIGLASPQTQKEEFTNGFFNSMNAATTLYWQIPFTTYDPDQFFALGMDGFSPIGWKNFTFKSVAQRTTKPILVQKMSTLSNFSVTFNPQKFSENLQIKVLNNQLSNMNKGPESQLQTSNNRFNQINQYRRIQKRYKRVKKHPRPPVWFPSGALTSQILPVHYIYVFYKRYSLPRDRYVRRRLRVNQSQSFATATNNQLQFYNYTLRKRIKPKRKYHRKNFKFLRKNENLVQTIFRRQFREYSTEKIRFRPSSSFIIKQSEIKSRKKSGASSSGSGKNKLSNKSSRDNLRLRQLRRRVQRQVFRPVWRYKPQAGGFIWPGDYLRLDLIKAPKLGSLSTSNSALTKDAGITDKTTASSQQKQRKIRKKKRRMIPEWQIQPKKYLLQKHNMKVLKKRLEKSQTKVY